MANRSSKKLLKVDSFGSKIPFWKKQQMKDSNKAQSAPKAKSSAIDFVLASSSEVGISMPYHLYDGKKKQLIKVII